MSDIVKVGAQRSGGGLNMTLIELLLSPESTAQDIAVYSATEEGIYAWASLPSLPKNILYSPTIMAKIEQANLQSVIASNAGVVSSIASVWTAFYALCTYPSVLADALRNKYHMSQFRTNTALLGKVFAHTHLRTIIFDIGSKEMCRRLLQPSSTSYNYLVANHMTSSRASHQQDFNFRTWGIFLNCEYGHSQGEVFINNAPEVYGTISQSLGTMVAKRYYLGHPFLSVGTTLSYSYYHSYNYIRME